MAAMVCLMLIAVFLMNETGSPPSGNGRDQARPAVTKTAKAPAKRQLLHRTRTRPQR